MRGRPADDINGPAGQGRAAAATLDLIVGNRREIIRDTRKMRVALFKLGGRICRAECGPTFVACLWYWV